MKKLSWLSLLLFASTARAALVTLDVSGSSSINTASTFASDPSLPPGSTGLDPLYGPYFVSYFSSGSSITIETDRNGNGLAHDWLLVGGTLNVDMTMPLGALGSIVVHETISLSGGEATQSGDLVFWSHYALTQWSAAGTWQCFGAGICGIVGVPDGSSLPIATLNQVAGVANYDPMYLGLWQLDPTHSTVLASTQAANQVWGPGVSPPVGVPGQPAQWFQFGPTTQRPEDPNGTFPFAMPQPPYPTDIPDPAEPGTGALGLICAVALAYVARARRVA